ncbi:hypothetical protein D3C72_1227450 [compost metagenome]
MEDIGLLTRVYTIKCTIAQQFCLFDIGLCHLRQLTDKVLRLGELGWPHLCIIQMRIYKFC